MPNSPSQKKKNKLMSNNKIIHTQNEYGIRTEAQDFPMMVVLSFIYVCNAKCPNCPYNNSNIRSDYKDAMIMPDELFRKIAVECGKHKSLLRLSGGGEPMLHPNAVELIEFAKKQGCRIGLITNGSCFDKEKLTRLIDAGTDAIEFSVDAGNSETYKKVRPGLNWDRLNQSVKMTKQIRDEKKSDTRIICSIINQQDVDIKAAEDHWRPLVDKIQVRKYLTWGYNEANSADESPYLEPEKHLPCPWLFERLNIDSRGDVTLCGEDIAFEHRFANVKDRMIEDIWKGTEFSSYREKHLNMKGHEIPICSTCADWKYRSWQYNYWKVLDDADTRKSEIIGDER